MFYLNQSPYLNLKKKNQSCKKRHFLLLEVIIAFTLILLCLFPLISPHIYMWKEQNALIDKIELDRMATLIYADINTQLFLNHIAWNAILEGHPVSIASSELADEVKRLPYKGTFTFSKIKDKPKKKKGRLVALMTLNLAFEPKWTTGDPVAYKYDIVMDYYGTALFPGEDIGDDE